MLKAFYDLSDVVLIENPGADTRLNHLGVEVEDQATVAREKDRLVGQGLVAATEEGVTCCYAVQDKVWALDPDRAPWEFYTVIEDAESMGQSSVAGVNQQACCSS